MKKTTVKLLALLLCAVMLTGILSACGQESLEGTWAADYDMGGLINEMMAEADETMARHMNFDGIKLRLIFEFDKNGECSLYADEDAWEDTVEDLKAKMTEGMRGYLEEVLAESGVSLDEYLASQGITLEEIVDQSFDAESVMDLDSISSEGYYRVEDGKLYIAEDEDDLDDAGDYVEYELDGDTLELSEYVGEDDSEIEMLFPLTFERID